MHPIVVTNQSVPTTKTERERIRSLVADLPPENSASRARLEELARSIADEPYLAWTMVLIGSHFWRDRVRAVPFNRRLLLLPHCMRNSAVCKAKYDAEGLLCENCGACPLGNLKTEAESLGYHVMIAEGSPVVMQWILGGKADAILGLGCLRSLERAFDKLQLAGIPALAVPLLTSDCKDSTTDLDMVLDMIRTPCDLVAQKLKKHNAGPEWIHLLRGASRLFETDEKQVDAFDPVKATGKIALDFLKRGGKFYRPFITLASYDALTGSRGTESDGAEQVERFSESVRAVARAVEIFHKASLIHDDIEDDDLFRYGNQTLHRTHGIPVAVNVGDYLLGLGYKTLADQRANLPGDIVSEMLARLSDAHTKLSAGQGAEFAWKDFERIKNSCAAPPLASVAMDGPPPQHTNAGNALKGSEPQVVDILRIYVLKTAPAFEAAMALGVLLAVADDTVTDKAVDWDFYRRTKEVLARFSRHLGVAFQIRNDIDDWQPDRMNKKIAGGDAMQDRPTLLRALAGKKSGNSSPEEILEHFRRAYVFETARQLAGKHAQRAREAAGEIEHPFFRRLLLHFVDTIAGI